MKGEGNKLGRRTVITNEIHDTSIFHLCQSNGINSEFNLVMQIRRSFHLCTSISLGMLLTSMLILQLSTILGAEKNIRHNQERKLIRPEPDSFHS